MSQGFLHELKYNIFGCRYDDFICYPIMIMIMKHTHSGIRIL